MEGVCCGYCVGTLGFKVSVVEGVAAELIVVSIGAVGTELGFCSASVVIASKCGVSAAVAELAVVAVLNLCSW